MGYAFVAEAWKGVGSVQFHAYGKSHISRTVAGMKNGPLNKIPKFILRVMPNASESELLEATEAFRQYVAIIVRLYTRLRQEEESRIRQLGVSDVDSD